MFASLGPWYQLYVKAPHGNGYTNARAMKRIDDHLIEATGFSANFVCPPSGGGLPVQNADGTWEVRVTVGSFLEKTKLILTGHYGLEIVREERHDE